MLPIQEPYLTLGDVLSALAELEQLFLSKDDRRAVFATTYLQMTRELDSRISGGAFEDNEWVGKAVVTFADLYRQALVAYENGDRSRLPKAWQKAFDVSHEGSGLLIHDLVLGVNAHINHDLPVSLYEVSIDPERQSRYRDHTAINGVLRQTTDPVQNRIAELYSPWLSLLDLAAGDVDEIVTNFSFEKARDAAWWWAVSLVDAQNAEHRMAVRRHIDDQAGVLANLIARPNDKFPWLIEALRWIEDKSARAWADWLAG